MLKLGSKTLLWGTHQFLLHPIGVFAAFLKIHRRSPYMRDSPLLQNHRQKEKGLPAVYSRRKRKRRYE